MRQGPNKAIVAAAASAGIALIKNIPLMETCIDSRTAATRGPTMEPMRPMPNAHHTPVERICVG